MPKHIWEKVEDPLTYTFYPPVGTSAYTLYDYDQNGKWFIVQRREDWSRSAIGKSVGKPKPKYIMIIDYGTSEKYMIAMAKHELDWGEHGYELFGSLKKQNPYVQSFQGGFPYVWLSGICDHGAVFNHAVYPFNLTNVRWALALTINMTELNIVALNAMGRMAAFRSLSVDFIEPFFIDELLPWIKDLELSDGYKPFDDTIPEKIGKYVESQGETLPSAPKTIYGQGWWKYDPEEAASLLESEGFTRDANGKWHLPNGDLWTVKLSMPGAWHSLGQRIGFGVFDAWQKFGIEVISETADPSIYWKDWATGNFDVKIAWPFCNAVPDVWLWWQSQHRSYLKPLGETAVGAQFRWDNEEFSDLLDQLAVIPSNDPNVIPLVTEMAKITIKDMVVINMFLGSKLICFDNYVWTNFPWMGNRYAEPCYWSPNMWKVWVLPKLESTGNLPSEYTEEKPETPVTPLIGTLNETIISMATTITAMNQTITTLETSINTLSSSMASLENQISMLTNVVMAEAVIIIVVVLLGAFIARKK